MTIRERTRDDELIALLLGERAPSAATRRWLATPGGARALRRDRALLAALDAWSRATAGAPRAAAAPTPVPTVYYGAIATPVGSVLAAVGEHGLVRMSFERSEARFVRALGRGDPVRLVRSRRQLGAVSRQLADYFRGSRTRFDLPIDLRALSPFQRRVLAAARRVPAGRVASYGDIARRIGMPGASRAVGQALGKNPMPIVIPCHRVVAGAGLGGYVGGLAIKRKLLGLEGARLAG